MRILKKTKKTKSFCKICQVCGDFVKRLGFFGFFKNSQRFLKVLVLDTKIFKNRPVFFFFVSVCVASITTSKNKGAQRNPKPTKINGAIRPGLQQSCEYKPSRRPLVREKSTQ